MKKYGRRKHCLSHHCADRYNKFDDTDHFRHRTRIPAAVYKRRRKVNPNDSNVHIDFVDETGDAF